MTSQDMRKVREEFLIFLRNSNVLSTTLRGVTTKTDTFTATAGQIIFTTTASTVRNIRTVTVQGVTKKPYADYTPNYVTGAASTVTLTVGASVGNTVAITYDYSAGTSEKVWPDFPEIQYLPTSCPRVGFDFMAARTQPVGIGSVSYLTDYYIIVRFYDFGSYLNLESYISTLRTAVMANSKNFYHFKFVYVSHISNMKNLEEINKRVYERDVDLIAKFAFES